MDIGYTTIADSSEWKVDKDGAFFHYCDNETIQGFEFHDFPFEVVGDLPLISDMSSNLCSRPIDWSKHALVYAGAHKNVGPAGVTIVIVREDLIGKQSSNTPFLFDYKEITEFPTNLHNTPCCWSLYVCGLNL